MSPTLDQLDLVAGLHAPLCDHPKVEPGPVVGDEQVGHVRHSESQTDPEARDPRLGDFELGGTDAVPIAHAHLIVRQPGDREVLAELSPVKVSPVEVPAPVPIRLDLVDHDRALLAAVTGGVALAVAVEVEPAGHDRSVDRVLPDSGVDGAAVPVDVSGEPDVDRQHDALARRRRAQVGRQRCSEWHGLR
jgi:hypothetical protein